MQPESTPNTSQESPAGSVPNAPPQPPQDMLDIIQIQQYFSSASGVFEPQRLLKGYRDLSKVNALLKANRLLELSAAGTTKKKKGGKLDSALMAEQEQDILQFAKHCIVTIDLWVEEAHVFEERPLANADLIYRTARYESADSEQDALYAEFYSALKKEHHFFFAKNYGPARDLFQKSTSDGCSTFLSCVKNETFQPIFGTLIPSAGTMGFDVSTNPQCLELLGYKSSSKTYSPLPPILWDNGEKGDTRFIFQSTILMKILFVIFYGPTSLKLKDSNKPVKSKTTNAILWKLEEVTPGTIAYAATVACFVLAGDERFDKRGAQSGINYASDYYQYKKTIIETISTPYMKETITTYNQFLFDGRPSRHGLNRCGVSDDDVEFVQLHEAFATGSYSESDTPATAASSHNEVQNVHMPEARHSQRVRVATILGDNDLAVTAEANVTQAKGHGHGVIPRGKAGGRGHGTQKQSDVPQLDARPTHRNTQVDTQQQVVQDESEGLEDDDVYG
ncbi:hypothetical protein ARMSODRAFT_980465 [Armillaria solidipes]|uniref:Uncharacterized protein n=1 Tax=Armillaria solidipes TaxID=1076256 RepID=A0A2H3BE10_9AGAR|nr:hypothetical protein ARMSODRAFT_980465 [Armillaria solidipes]